MIDTSTKTPQQAEDGEDTLLLLQCKSRPRPGSRLAVKLFEMESGACRLDVEAKMRAVARELTSRNQELLGSLLFSCNGRGPTRFLDLHDGASAGVDARVFTAAFPNTPVAGFYAMGEIGPQSIWSDPSSALPESSPQQPQPPPPRSASVGEEGQQHVAALAASQTGESALQGFTAVFGVFCVPKRKQTNRGSPLMERLHRHGTAAALAGVLGRPSVET